MSLVHDIIKIHYVSEGYLPDYPYHLISDAEMCDAFLYTDMVGMGSEHKCGCCDECDCTIDDNIHYIYPTKPEFQYFYDYYPNVGGKDTEEYYNTLVEAIKYHLMQLKASHDTEYTLPNWVYSYMLGVAIGPRSDVLDIHDMLVSMDVDNLDDIYTPEAAIQCYKYSKAWLNRLPNNGVEYNRPPTIFGEPHVLKYLRLIDTNMQ